jgi:hypothetical protein
MVVCVVWVAAGVQFVAIGSAVVVAAVFDVAAWVVSGDVIVIQPGKSVRVNIRTVDNNNVILFFILFIIIT